ncbi:HD-GYP domain-containing protein [Roseateles sp.]|uniref:HD-GYP domain-containing protein n=1 Tax=Roseateles sp. TaxID=1971397 RepID=UPI0039ED3487
MPSVDVSTEEMMFSDAAAAQMERLVQDLGRMYQERNEALREVARAHHEALLRLSLAADFKDDDTGVHIVRIGYLAEALARLLGESEKFSCMLRRAAPMHDIGKIGIPDDVLKKPGAYNAQERAVMNEHPRMGAEILGRSRVPLFRLAAEVALGHHERWDGSGYPGGLAGEEIPLSARIVAVVDYMDALTMDRCYRKAFSDEKALQMLAEQRGAAFDPRLVDLFLAHAPALLALRDRINAQPPSFEELSEDNGPNGEWRTLQ